MEQDTRGETLSAGSGDVFLAALPDRPYTLRCVDVELQLVQLDQAVVADLSVPSADHPALFTGCRPVSRAAGRHCTGLLAYLAEDVLVDDAAASPMVVEQAARLLGAALLTTFPNTLDDRHDDDMSAPATLRRAIAFIEEHAGEPIGLADIAAAAHVTPRTVQLTFRQRLATTPTEYLRRVRLDRAHQDLLAADPAGGASVTSVARGWGFHHEGRFAARYRQVYGRSPRETLHGADRARRDP